MDEWKSGKKCLNVKTHENVDNCTIVGTVSMRLLFSKLKNVLLPYRASHYPTIAGNNNPQPWIKTYHENCHGIIVTFLKSSFFVFRWFVSLEDADSGTFCYVYKGAYWKARLKGQFVDSPYIYWIGFFDESFVRLVYGVTLFRYILENVPIFL